MGHVIAALGELERADARRIELRHEASEEFDRELREALAGSVWHTGCTNWYGTHRLHELVRRRERQRSEPVGLAVEHLSAPDGADRPGVYELGTATRA